MNSGKITPSMKSPAIVQSNADYKRPASIQPSVRSEDDGKPLPRNWSGTLFLTLHVFIAILLVLVSLFALIFDFVCEALKIAGSSIEGIPKAVVYIISIISFASLTASTILPVKLLFKSSNFLKSACFKKNWIFFDSSCVVILSGLISVIIHLYLYYIKKETQLTAYLPAGVFLLLNGLLNLKLAYELEDGGVSAQTILLPYSLERKGNEMEMELSNV